MAFYIHAVNYILISLQRFY